MALAWKRQLKDLQIQMAYVPGATMQAVQIPTDLPITKILVTIKGTPTGVSSSAGTLNAPFAPGLAAALGMFSLTGSPEDGGDGLQMKNIPFTAAYMDSYTMNGLRPPCVDLTPATPATPCSLTVPIHFMDERLDDNQKIFTALEAQRYGAEKNLQLSILTGVLQAATGGNDTTGVLGGTYSTAWGAGTLSISVAIEQLVPLNFTWPAWNSSHPMPMLDRDFEYQYLSAVPSVSGQNYVLARRRIQANTMFLNAGQVASTLAETGINNLGQAPNPLLANKVGAQPLDSVNPDQLQADSHLKLFYGGSTGASTVLPGMYYYNDWQDSLTHAASLLKANGSHAWDLNMGTVPGGYVSQSLRSLHITYNPSRAAKLRNKAL